MTVHLNFVGENVIRSKKYCCKCKKQIRHYVCKDNFAWNSSISACKCDKDCEIGEYLDNFINYY